MSFVFRIILLVVIISLLEFYFIRKVHQSVREYFPEFAANKLGKWTTWILIFFNLYPAFLTATWIYSSAFNGGRVDLPQSYWFDYLLTYPFWTGIIIIVQSSLFFLLFDITKGFIFLFTRKRYWDKIRHLELKIFPFLIIGFLLYVPVRIIYDYHSIDVNKIEYYKAGLPKELKDFKLVLISDIQADKYTNRYRLGKFINLVNEQKPDLILIAGDLITSTPDYINLSAEYTGKLRAPLGVYACVGDHDNWAYREDNARSIREITEALAVKKVRMINNGNLVFNFKGKKIAVTFVTNTYVERISPQELDQLTNVSTDADLRIFLTHQPRSYLVDEAVKRKYDMYLAGHTHGGQITFLFPFINLSPTLFETIHVRGRFDYGSLMMYITRGLGMSLVPMRYNSTPEITVINVK